MFISGLLVWSGKLDQVPKRTPEMRSFIKWDKVEMMANFKCIDDRGLNQKSGSFLQIYERLLYGKLIVLTLH